MPHESKEVLHQRSLLCSLLLKALLHTRILLRELGKLRAVCSLDLLAQFRMNRFQLIKSSCRISLDPRVTRLDRLTFDLCVLLCSDDNPEALEQLRLENVVLIKRVALRKFLCQARRILYQIALLVALTSGRAPEENASQHPECSRDAPSTKKPLVLCLHVVDASGELLLHAPLLILQHRHIRVDQLVDQLVVGICVEVRASLKIPVLVVPACCTSEGANGEA